MINTVKKFWMPIAGAGSSISIKAIGQAAQNTHEFLDAVPQMATQATPQAIIYYFWIGVAGAAGGLILKIMWGCVKRIFPKLKNIDK